MKLHDKLTAIQKELKVKKTRRNNFGNYNYRSAEDIMEAVKPLIAKHECSLFLSDTVNVVEGNILLTAIATLKSEGETMTTQSVAGVGDLKGMSKSQTFGAASSYARKYCLNGLFLIDDSLDDDKIIDADTFEVSEKQPEPKGQTPTDKKKQDLVNPSKRWENVVKRLENGSATIDTVTNAFNISEADLKVLKSIKKK